MIVIVHRLGGRQMSVRRMIAILALSALSFIAFLVPGSPTGDCSQSNSLGLLWCIFHNSASGLLRAVPITIAALLAALPASNGKR